MRHRRSAATRHAIQDKARRASENSLNQHDKKTEIHRNAQSLQSRCPCHAIGLIVRRHSHLPTGSNIQSKRRPVSSRPCPASIKTAARVLHTYGAHDQSALTARMKYQVKSFLSCIRLSALCMALPFTERRGLHCL